MPRFDPDIIAALAEGRLPADEAARIEREIANDPAALADLTMHRTALEALTGAREIRLTDLERAGLHAAVADAIGLVDTAPQAATAPRRVPWGSLGIAAAALFGLVAVVPVVGLLNTAGDDDAAGAALPPIATTVAESSSDGATEADTAAPEQSGILSSGGFDAAQEAPGDDVVGFGSTTTAAARVTTTAAIEEVAPDTSLGDAGEAAVDPLVFEDLVADLGVLWEDAVEVKAVAALALEEDLCWLEDTELRGDDPGDRWTFGYEDEEHAVVVFFQFDEDGLPGPFAVYSDPECTAIATVPEAP